MTSAKNSGIPAKNSFTRTVMNSRMKQTISAALLALTSMACAFDGGQLYETYCGACHGKDGKGANDGDFPPLANSAWVKGDAERSIQIVLHGLVGQIEVDDKLYNLAMPPQGEILSDPQIAAILTYVRSSWGHEEAAVKAEDVAKARQKSKNRSTPWRPVQIQNAYPLPKPDSPIKNLLSYVYKGKWQKLPDFSKLKPESVEEEHDGIISVKKVGLKDFFGVVWEGDLTVPKTDKYVFRLGADDGARVIIDSKVVVELNSPGGLKHTRKSQKAIQLSEGVHKLRVEFFELEGEEGVALSWRPQKEKKWQHLSDLGAKMEVNPIPVEPTSDRAAIYRNFIKGTTHRAIGIGFPSHVNMAYSADNLAPEIIWLGAFMDGSRHWVNRGQGDQPPAGDHLYKLTGSMALPETARFRGYELDKAGNPTFTTTWEELTYTDAFKAEETKLIRTIKLNGKGDPVDIPIISNLPFESRGKDWTVAGTLEITSSDNGIYAKDKDLLLKVSPGKEVTLTYQWR